jgi:hypothetical protein
MPSTFTIDSRQFTAALNSYMASTAKALPEILNQRAYNIAGRAAGYVPLPGGAQAQRQKVQAYLRLQLSSKLKLVTIGFRTVSPFSRKRGRVALTGTKVLRASGSRNRQLQRVHLIANKIMGKLGRKGLWGGATERTGRGSKRGGLKTHRAPRTGRMLQYSGEMVRRAQAVVGYLRAVWLPIVRGLFPFIKYRRIDGPDPHPFRGISLWEGGAGKSTVRPARPGFNPFAELIARIKTHTSPRVLGPNQDAKVMAIERAALQHAFDDEARELMAHTARNLQEEANKVNAKAA